MVENDPRRVLDLHAGTLLPGLDGGSRSRGRALRWRASLSRRNLHRRGAHVRLYIRGELLGPQAAMSSIMLAATVSFVASSITMNAPVTLLSAYRSTAI